MDASTLSGAAQNAAGWFTIFTSDIINSIEVSVGSIGGILKIFGFIFVMLITLYILCIHLFNLINWGKSPFSSDKTSFFIVLMTVLCSLIFLLELIYIYIKF